jgi:hypothetical protein
MIPNSGTVESHREGLSRPLGDTTYAGDNYAAAAYASGKQKRTCSEISPLTC